jgi:hypothetical protein
MSAGAAALSVRAGSTTLPFSCEEHNLVTRVGSSGGVPGGVVRPVASETGLFRVQIKLRFDPNSTKSPHLQRGIAVTEKSDPCADAP